MRAFPLLLLPLIFYNLLAFGGGLVGGAAMAELLEKGFTLTLPSGDAFPCNWGLIFITISFGLLFAEIVKATRTGRGEIMNHALSTLTFVAALIEFLLLKGFASGAFFLLTAMCLFDVVAGYTISIVAARRDLMVPQEQ